MTRTLAIPSTCLSRTACHSQQQATHIAHQIGRIAMHYGVDEIVVYDCNADEEEDNNPAQQQPDQPKKIVFDEELKEEDEETGKKQKSKDAPSPEAVRLANLLQFFVTPSYLRPVSFDDLKPFQYAKKLPKLPRLPFMNHKSSRYLEGLTVPSNKIPGVKKYKKGQQKSKKQLELSSKTKLVNVGAEKMIELNRTVPVNTRVTVDTLNNVVVSPKDAYRADFFGYAVRVAKTFGKVFTESAVGEYTMGVYVPCGEFVSPSKIACQVADSSSDKVKNGANVLLVYGKWDHVATAIMGDPDLESAHSSPEMLFDGKISSTSVCLRVEDAVTISLAKMEG